MKKLAVSAAIVAAAAFLVPASTATTKPGVVYGVRVLVTDSTIRVSHARYVRGAIIRYEIKNRGTKPYRFVIVGFVTRALRPGQGDTILVNWNYRGRFMYRTQVKVGGAWRNTGVKGFITIV